MALSATRNCEPSGKQFSRKTRLYPGAPAELVRLLHEKWCSRNSGGQPPSSKTIDPPGYIPPPSVPPPRFVFVSYAREDGSAVKEFAAGLHKAGIPYWFDREKLDSGEHFPDSIGRAVRGCKLFVAVVSRNTERAGERWFKKEWNLARERNQHRLPLTCHLFSRWLSTIFPSQLPRLYPTNFWSATRRNCPGVL